MHSYLLYAPAVGEADDRVAEQAKVAADRFSWLAFLAPVPWFLYHRCWLAAVVMFAVSLALILLARFLLLPSAYVLLALALAHIYAGLEAGAIWGKALKRRGFALVDVAVARNRAEAEAGLIARLSGSTSAPGKAAATQAPMQQGVTVGVVGLFPEPEVRR